MYIGILLIFFSVLADQFSKYWIDTQLVLDKPIEIFELLNITKVWNTGVSFSMFNNYGNAGTIFLSLFALVVVAFLLHWMWNEQNKLKIAALGLIVGGALGNVADRVRFGAVMDFIDFHYADLHWPAFNLADSFICVGACLLIFMELFANHNKKGLYEV